MRASPIARSSDAVLERRHRAAAVTGAVLVWGLLWWAGLPLSEDAIRIAVPPYEIESKVIDEDTAIQLYPVLRRGGGRKLFDPVAFVVNLPDYVKKRLYIVHVAGGGIPKGSGLKVAKGGLNRTIRIRIGTGQHNRTCTGGVENSKLTALARTPPASDVVPAGISTV